MVYESLLGPLDLLDELGVPLKMPQARIEVVGDGMGEGPVAIGEVIGDRGLESDLESLQALNDAGAQLPIEIVKDANILKGRARDELVSLALKRDAISAQAVIVRVGEECFRRRVIPDLQASGFKQLELLPKAQRRLVVFFGHL